MLVVEVAVELIKVVKRCALDKYRNAFLNLALPMFVLSEPGPPKTTKLRSVDSIILQISTYLLD